MKVNVLMLSLKWKGTGWWDKTMVCLNNHPPKYIHIHSGFFPCKKSDFVQTATDKSETRFNQYTEPIVSVCLGSLFFLKYTKQLKFLLL